jgi:hypothetical protein
MLFQDDEYIFLHPLLYHLFFLLTNICIFIVHYYLLGKYYVVGAGYQTNPNTYHHI